MCLWPKYLLPYSEKGELWLSVKILTIDLVIAKLEYLTIDPDYGFSGGGGGGG